jgi:hypothetical protein
VKVILKFLFSILILPFLLPWFLADKSFEYFFQPVIFRRHNIELPRRKVYIIRFLKTLFPVLFLAYLVKRGFDYWRLHDTVLETARNFKIFFMLLFNDFAKTLNFLLWPLNRLIYYTSGGFIESLDFFLAFYFWLLPIIFFSNLLYRLIGTRRSINKAAELRDRAVRDVDIIHFTKLAKEDQIFLGLDLNREGQPFYANRQWLKGHFQVIGGPGSGKTASIIQPIWFQEVRRNVATFVLDGKASTRNVDKFYTIASSMAQAEDILYFNPSDLKRSATYNPLLRGSAGDVKRKIMASINWTEHSTPSREHFESALNIFLRTMEKTGSYFNLEDLLEFFQSRDYLQSRLAKVQDPYLKNGLQDIINSFSEFHKETAFFIDLANDLLEAGYGKLLNTRGPEIDIVGVYYGRKDCYFTLPMQSDQSSMRFLGQLILEDIRHCFHHIAMHPEEGNAEEGLLIIDEMVKFVSPHFIEVLKASRDVGVSVCYTNQSLAELDNPALGLSKVVIDQLADHTNAVFCFQLGSPESIQMMIDRFGKVGSDDDENNKTLKITDPNFLKHLEVGKCVAFIRHPRYLTILKTGYFKFDKLLHFSGQQEDVPEINVVN